MVSDFELLTSWIFFSCFLSLIQWSNDVTRLIGCYWALLRISAAPDIRMLRFKVLKASPIINLHVTRSILCMANLWITRYEYHYWCIGSVHSAYTVEFHLVDTLNGGHPCYNGQFWLSISHFHGLQYVQTPLNSGHPAIPYKGYKFWFWACAIVNDLTRVTISHAHH